MKIPRNVIPVLFVILLIVIASVAVTYCIMINSQKVRPAYEIGTILTDGKDLNVITHLFFDEGREPVYGIIKLSGLVDTITQEVSFTALPFTQDIRGVDAVRSVSIFEMEDIRLLYGLNPMFVEIPE